MTTIHSWHCTAVQNSYLSQFLLTWHPFGAFTHDCHQPGETIPLSDSDEEQDSDTESLDGVQREADMFLLSKAVSQFGVRPEAVRIAASMMRAKRGVLRAALPCTHSQCGGLSSPAHASNFCRQCDEMSDTVRSAELLS